MRASEALIAWTRADDAESDIPSGSVAVGHLIAEGDRDWTHGYPCTGGAAETSRRRLTGAAQKLEVLRDFYLLVYVYGIHPYVAHRALLHVDEYQELTKEIGAGPDRGELGHDPNVGFGRASSIPVPPVAEHRIGSSVHIWPAAPSP